MRQMYASGYCPPEEAYLGLLLIKEWVGWEGLLYIKFGELAYYCLKMLAII